MISKFAGETAGSLIFPRVLALLLLHLSLYPALAVEPPQNTPPAVDQNDDEQARRDALSWLNRYLAVEVLFRDEDLKAISEQVAAMPPDELKAWIRKTKEVRSVLDSPEWAETREWLRDFLKKQAYYSDEEVEQFRADAATKSGEELLEVLDRIREKHRTMIFMSESSRAQNRIQLEAQQRRLQDATRRASTAKTGGDRPLFGASQSHAARQVKASSGYQIPKPLITSREVARDTVRRSVSGRGYWWGR